MHRLKQVSHRHTDALTRVGWDQLEAMLAVYYRGQGYRVEHVGTGGTGAQFDGGIDLKLHKDDAYILVQCKHWNAMQVPHNDVHQLIGVMVNEGATGAILVTSGEFTRAAIEAATKQGHVQLVDGNDLRGMLGPLPDSSVPKFAGNRQPASFAHGMASTVGERLLCAVEERIRYGGRRPGGRRGGWGGDTLRAGIALLMVKFVMAAIMFLIVWLALQSAIGSIIQTAVKPVVQQTRPQVSPMQQRRTNGVAVQNGPAGMAAYRVPTAAEMRESQRQADEAARIIEASTPEM